MRLEAIFQDVTQQVAAAVIVPSAMRGIPRREVRLSPGRLQALLAGQDLEVTLERTMVALMAVADGMPEFWGNQLNVAGGVGGGNAFNRRAVDIIRLRGDGQQVHLGLKELKAWGSNDPLRGAAAEIFRYCAYFQVLRQKGVPPYDRWPKIDDVQMHLLGPYAYFVRHGGVSAARAVLATAEAELAGLRRANPELCNVSFASAPIVLGAGIGAADFVACFDAHAVETLIRTGSAAASPLDVLRPDKLGDLRDWLSDALV